MFIVRYTISIYQYNNFNNYFLLITSVNNKIKHMYFILYEMNREVIKYKYKYVFDPILHIYIYIYIFTIIIISL